MVGWVQTLPTMKMVARSNQPNAFYYIHTHTHIIFGLWICFDGFRVLNVIFNWKPEKRSMYRWKRRQISLLWKSTVYNRTCNKHMYISTYASHCWTCYSLSSSALSLPGLRLLCSPNTPSIVHATVCTHTRTHIHQFCMVIKILRDGPAIFG